MSAADWTDSEDYLDRAFRSGRLAEPITFHPEPWPQHPATSITLAVDDSPLRGVFAPAHVDVDVDAGVEIVTRRIVVEVRLADFADPPIAGEINGEGGSQWTIRGALYKTVKIEPLTPGWIRCQLHHGTPPPP